MTNNRKIIEDLNDKAKSFETRAGGYRMAGMRSLAGDFTRAASASRALAKSLGELDKLEAKARGGLSGIEAA